MRTLRHHGSRRGTITIRARSDRAHDLQREPVPESKASSREEYQVRDRKPGDRRGRFHDVSARIGSFHLLFLLTLAIGILARTWEFGRLPPGLNPDEASIGVEAWDLYRFGMDRNGMTFPVHFIAWGSGQNALYAYMLVPFVGLLGLKPVVVRLPMLISGILSLPLMYHVGAMSLGRRPGLLAMFLLAISPWHVLLSRWSLESNLLPFVFLLGYVCLVRCKSNGWWFVPACTFFAGCLYAYGTAYAAIPIFMALALVSLVRRRHLDRAQLGAGLTVFAVLSAPIALMLVVNAVALPPIMLGPITIPRFPVTARYADTTLFGTLGFLHGLGPNLGTAIRLLVTESDGLIYNVVEPFGYFYRLFLPIAILGMVVMASTLKEKGAVAVQLLWAWLAAAALLAVLQPVNINRWNLLFMPLLLSLAYGLSWIDSRIRGALPILVSLLVIAFVAFSGVYHGEDYRRQAEWKFNHGLLPALEFVEGMQPPRVCITDKITMPYIFALFSRPMDPRTFLATVEYVDANEALRRVNSFDRYTFGVHRCPLGEGFTYVLTGEEVPPRFGNRYQYEFFDNFVVFFPRQE